MNLNHLNIVLGVLLTITSVCAISMNVDHTEPNYVVLPEMVYSPASKAYSANAVLPQERTMQPSVTGTIPRGELPLYYEATKEDAIRAGEELVNPFKNSTTTSPVIDTEVKLATESNSSAETLAVDPIQELNASIQRGAENYRIFCVSCHGATGAGDGPVAKRGFPPPPPLSTGKSVQMKDGQLFHILTYGQGSMAPMAAQLDRCSRWDVINYVRSLQSEQTPNPEPAIPDQQGEKE